MGLHWPPPLRAPVGTSGAHYGPQWGPLMAPMGPKGLKGTPLGPKCGTLGAPMEPPKGLIGAP
jgi:hypothetical protein